MDSRGAPEGIRRGHFPDQGRDLGVDRRAATGGPAGELGPVLAEAPPLPPQNDVGSNDHERLPPPGPNLGQPDPEGQDFPSSGFNIDWKRETEGASSANPPFCPDPSAMCQHNALGNVETEAYAPSIVLGEL
jgi:hypothetical protein